MWQKNIAPSEWDDKPYWEFEEFIKMMNGRNKEEGERQKTQDKDSMQHVPKMGDFKVPNYNLPKY